MTVYVLLETILDEKEYEAGSSSESTILGVYTSKEEAQKHLKYNIGRRKNYLNQHEGIVEDYSAEILEDDWYSITWFILGVKSDFDFEDYTLRIIEMEVSEC